MRTKKLKKLVLITMVLMLNFLYLPVFAASLTSVSDTLSRQKAGEASNHTIKFTTPTGIANGNTVELTFPGSSFTMGASLTGVTIADGAGADNAVTSASWAAPKLTITASSSSVVAAGHVATIKIPNTQITNPAVGVYVVTIGGSFGDTGSFAVPIITNEQVVLTATVNPSITFSLSGNTSTFTTELSPGIVRTAGSVISITVGTNGNGGYMVTVRDAGNGANPGLYNSAASALIGSADGSYSATADLDSVAYGYGLQAACTAGCTTGTHINSDYRQVTNIVGALTLTDKNLVTYNSATASDHTITNTYKARASASTKAGTYTDTLTYIATATF